MCVFSRSDIESLVARTTATHSPDRRSEQHRSPEPSAGTAGRTERVCQHCTAAPTTNKQQMTRVVRVCERCVCVGRDGNSLRKAPCTHLAHSLCCVLRLCVLQVCSQGLVARTRGECSAAAAHMCVPQQKLTHQVSGVSCARHTDIQPPKRGHI